MRGSSYLLKMSTLKKHIYFTHCKQCEIVYIGQTKRNLETRTKEHLRNLRLNYTEKSVITSHFWNTGHEIDNPATIKINQ